MPPHHPGLFLLLLCLAAPLAAQSVRGRIIAPDSTAIPGAIVTLVDSAGLVVARVLSSPLGGYTLRAPAAGRYAVRALRIGFPAFTGPVLQLAPGSAQEYSPILPEDPIVLNEIEVASGSACRSGEQSGATATLLEEVRKAFGSMELALRDRELRFEVDQYARRIDKRQAVTAADSLTRSMTTWPVHSLPAEELTARGFVQSADSVDPTRVGVLVAAGRIWFGPDPTTLFAESFLATHCYRVVVDRADRDRVGLAFEPVRGRRLSDIGGTLWLRRSSLALERLEYDYRNLPRHLTATQARGTMEFVRLPRGIWIVSRWDVRVPIEEVHNNEPIGVAGWLDEGGRIRSIRTVQGVQVF